MTDRKLWRVGFYVEVEVEAHDGEAALVAEAACRWPGDWRSPFAAVEVHGELRSKPVSARICCSQALMVKEAE